LKYADSLSGRDFSLKWVKAMFEWNEKVMGNNPAKVLAGLTTSLNELVVFNKCDLADDVSDKGLNISAKTGSGVQELIAAIEQKLGVGDFDIKKTVCFTNRQKMILEQIVTADEIKQIQELITKLLKDDFRV
jgi:tRNA U34 5-carboxymethylaminomethyl modifying GTPase MnmE/TrmE